MSDPGARHPTDDAYVRAEAALENDVARAARRARVLAAVASEQVLPARSQPAKRSPRRYVGALAAAAVAGLSLLTATELQRVGPHAPTQAPTTASPPADAPPAPTAVAKPPPVSEASDRSEVDRAAPTSPEAPSAGGGRTQADGAAPGPALGLTPPRPDLPPPPPLPIPPTPAPVRTSSDEVQASASTGDRGEADVQSSPESSARSGSTPAADPFDGPARLRAAAAAGRTSEVRALLTQGIPVDATDAEGETALMQSVRADHPATAALLRRYGASLDRVNKAGESAKALTAAKNDSQLSEAMSLHP